MADVQSPLTSLTIPKVAPKGRDIGFAIGIMVILSVLFLPIPSFMIDFGLAISIASSVLILMVSLWIQRPLDFSSFPTILLIATMLRLSLNIATTRVILSHGNEGHDAAGHVIAGFASLVMSGDFVIGLIVFLILIVVNFIVITKGATRIAEVGARFTLDAIPGKQMSIDADLSAGLIDEKQAQLRRRELEEESSFFGSMDGASKFVRGDAIAGLLITAINVFGGIIIGYFRHGMELGEAADVFVKLSVGDGLVSQIPALIVSLAAGPPDLAAAIEVWRRSDAGRRPDGVAGDPTGAQVMLADPTTFVVLARTVRRDPVRDPVEVRVRGARDVSQRIDVCDLVLFGVVLPALGRAARRGHPRLPALDGPAEPGHPALGTDGRHNATEQIALVPGRRAGLVGDCDRESRGVGLETPDSSRGIGDGVEVSALVAGVPLDTAHRVDRGGLAEDQAGRRPLAVVLGHQRIRDAAVDSALPRQRGHHNAVAQAQRARGERIEQGRHGWKCAGRAGKPAPAKTQTRVASGSPTRRSAASRS